MQRLTEGGGAMRDRELASVHHSPEQWYRGWLGGGVSIE